MKNLNKLNIILFFGLIWPVNFVSSLANSGQIFDFPMDSDNISLASVDITSEKGISSALSNPSLYNYNKEIYFSLQISQRDLINRSVLGFNIINKKDCFLNLIILKNSITDIPDTRDVWKDNGDKLIDPTELYYSDLKFYSQNDLGLIFNFKKEYNEINFGVNIKPYITSLLSYKCLGLRTDIGYISNLSDRFKMGFVVKDIINFNYWSVRNEGTSELIIPSLKVSMSYLFDKVNLIFGMNILDSKISSAKSEYNYLHTLDSFYFHLNSGLIYSYNKNLSFRLGMNNLGRYGFGFKINSKELRIGYGFYSSHSEFITNPLQALSISIDLSMLTNIFNKVNP